MIFYPLIIHLNRTKPKMFGRKRTDENHKKYLEQHDQDADQNFEELQQEIGKRIAEQKPKCFKNLMKHYETHGSYENFYSIECDVVMNRKLTDHQIEKLRKSFPGTIIDKSISDCKRDRYGRDMACIEAPYFGVNLTPLYFMKKD